MSTVISVAGLKKSYGANQAVNGVDLQISQGEIFALLGPNGAGKTTSFYMIVGLVKPDKGKVFLDQLDITKQAMYQRAQLGLGYLPQEVSVFRKLSVEDNIMAILEMTKLTKKQRQEKLEKLLTEFSLQKVRKTLGNRLSGGEKRRTEIARALALDPKFILLDEPFAGVDPISVNDIKDIITHLKNRGIGVLITDHNVRDTLDICEHAYIVGDGGIIAQGDADAILSNPQVRLTYLGEKFRL